MRRVLLVSPSARPGGAERALASLVRHLPANGYDPVVALLEKGPVERWLAEVGCRAVVLNGGRLRQPRRLVATVRSLAQIASSERAEVIVSSMGKGHVYGGSAGFLAHLPAIWWQFLVPDDRRFPARAIDRMAAGTRTAAVVCPSDQALIAQRQVTPRSRLSKIPLGADVQRIASYRGTGESIRADLVGDRTLLIGTIGRLEPGKRQDLFLRAAARLVRQRRGIAQFVVIGGSITGTDTGYPERLRQLTRELGIEELVHFTGHVDDPWRWIDACDVLVQLPVRESFGLALIEALVLGKPVISTPAGIAPDVVDPDFLIPFDEPDSAADAMARVAGDLESARNEAAASSVRARTYTEERMAEGFASLFEEVRATPD
jgi:glycosyltransferase involved in cell wall biosynthesis